MVKILRKNTVDKEIGLQGSEQTKSPGLQGSYMVRKFKMEIFKTVQSYPCNTS